MLKLEKKKKTGLTIVGCAVGFISVAGIYMYYNYLKQNQLEPEEKTSKYNNTGNTRFYVMSREMDAGSSKREKGRMRISG